MAMTQGRKRQLSKKEAVNAKQVTNNLLQSGGGRREHD
jgi:hypothetical protein